MAQKLESVVCAIASRGRTCERDFSEQSTQVYLNGEAFSEVEVAISVGGDVALASVISQGCTPIGETWTITKADRNFIHEIAIVPPTKCLPRHSAIFRLRSSKIAWNLFVGLVMNEYLDEFHRGDFLIRNLIGADPKSGALAVAPTPAQARPSNFRGETPLPAPKT